MSDVEKVPEAIVEKEAVVEETAQNDKKKVDSAKAAEMRHWALENLGERQKRQRKDAFILLLGFPFHISFMFRLSDSNKLD